MSAFPTQPNPVTPGGGFSAENAPQVVVRAGKTFVCSACGTLVEIPPEIVGQLVLAVEPSSQETPAAKSAIRDDVSQEAPREVTPAAVVTPSRTTTASGTRSEDHPRRSMSGRSLPARPKRPQRPAPVSLAGEVIDGLRVPSGDQLDRALAWVSFHLRVLDRQGSEIERLQKLLKDRPASPVPRPSPLGRAEKANQQVADAPARDASGRHAHEDVSMAPEAFDECDSSAQERGPP